MENKSTTSVQHVQHLIAGLLQDDSGIEFYGIPETKQVEWIQNGKSHSFEELPKDVFAILSNAYWSNEAARRLFAAQEDFPTTYKRRVELYTYFMYGGCDGSPDFVNGKLQEPENYRHSDDCISLEFKKIKLCGSPLKERELKMIDLMVKYPDSKDDFIAMTMGYAKSTFDQHKRELFNKTGLKSKPALVIMALKQNVARVFS